MSPPYVISGQMGEGAYGRGKLLARKKMAIAGKTRVGWIPGWSISDNTELSHPG